MATGFIYSVMATDSLSPRETICTEAVPPSHALWRGCNTPLGGYFGVKNENTPQGGYECVEKALYLCIGFSGGVKIYAHGTGGLKTPKGRDKLRTPESRGLKTRTPAGDTRTPRFTEQILHQTIFTN